MKTLRTINQENLYYMSEDGSVFKMKNNKLKEVKTFTRKDKYENIRVKVSGSWKTIYVHILMRMAFMDNDDKGLQINHINSDRSDNRLDNLELVSPKENIRKQPNHNLCFDEKKVVGKIDGKITIFNTIGECVIAIGGSRSGVSQCLSGLFKTYKGWELEII